MAYLCKSVHGAKVRIIVNSFLVTVTGQSAPQLHYQKTWFSNITLTPLIIFNKYLYGPNSHLYKGSKGFSSVNPKY